MPNGQISLKNLFSGNTDIAAKGNLSIEQIAKAICRGGWPSAVVSKTNSTQIEKNYINSVINIDVNQADNIDKDPEKVRLLLQSLARNISTMATAKTIMDDIRANHSIISDKTLNGFLNVLRRIFVIEDLIAWQPSLRSKTAIRTTNKRQFVDPSIATAVIQTNEKEILKDFETFGFLFECIMHQGYKNIHTSLGWRCVSL